VLRSYETVPGVAVSGTLSGGPIRLRIGGRRAAHGFVRLRSGGRLSGRLGGRRISVLLASAARTGVVFRVPSLPRLSVNRRFP
jgi:hypothetical protein